MQVFNGIWRLCGRDQAAASQGYFGDMNGVREQLGLVGDPDAAPPPASDARSPTSSPLIKRTRSAKRASAAATASAKQVTQLPLQPSR